MGKRHIMIGMAAAVLLAACAAQEESPDSSRGGDNLGASISWTDFDGVYQISLLDKEGGQEELYYEKAAGNQLYMLVVNGSFAAATDILTGWDGTPYISAEDLGILGIAAEPAGSETGKAVSLECHGDTLVLKKNRPAEKNGMELEDGFSAVGWIEEKAYVPICFVAEQFGGTAQYIKDFRKEICNDDGEYGLAVSFIVIEMPTTQQERAFTQEEGLRKARELSAEEYRQVTEYLEECERVFSEDDPDYDPSAIRDTGKTLGRYDIYELEGFETLPVFFNRYTGEIYGVQPWDPMLSINRSFPDISKIYQ